VRQGHEPCHAEALVPATFSFQIIIGDPPTPEKGGKARATSAVGAGREEKGVARSGKKALRAAEEPSPRHRATNNIQAVFLRVRREEHSGGPVPK